MAQPDEKLAVVQAIWLGPLSVMERLAIASFLANGHQIHLYSYDELEDVPAGAILMDASEILPANWVVRDSHGTFTAFSEAFRYKLLLERGGWWVDTDIVCLQPFDFRDEYILALEPDLTMSTAVIRVPPGSELMRYAWERAEAFRPRRRPFRTRIPWRAIGPRMFAEAVDACGLSDRALGPEVFYPLDWSDWDDVLDPGADTKIGPDTRAVHLWNSLWAEMGKDKEATYPYDCLYEQLKRRYLGTGR